MRGPAIGFIGCLVLVMGLAFGNVFADGSPQASVPSEVAVLTGTVSDGATIPLPTYGDGTPAAEDECHWMVSLNFQSFTEIGHTSNTIELTCATEGRTVHCFAKRDGTVVTTGTANYMIIAIRSAQASAGVPEEPSPPANATTWGKVKSEFAR